MSKQQPRNMKRFMFTLDAEAERQLDFLCDRLRTNKSQLIRQLLNDRTRQEQKAERKESK